MRQATRLEIFGAYPHRRPIPIPNPKHEHKHKPKPNTNPKPCSPVQSTSKSAVSVPIWTPFRTKSCSPPRLCTCSLRLEFSLPYLYLDKDMRTSNVRVSIDIQSGVRPACSVHSTVNTSARLPQKTALEFTSLRKRQRYLHFCGK